MREVDLHTSGRKDTGWSRRAAGIIKFKYRHGIRRRTEGEGQRKEQRKNKGSKGEDEDRQGGSQSFPSERVSAVQIFCEEAEAWDKEGWDYPIHDR